MNTTNEDDFILSIQFLAPKTNPNQTKPNQWKAMETKTKVSIGDKRDIFFQY